MKKILAVSLLSSLFAIPAMAATPGGYVALDAQSWSATNTSPLGNPGVGARIGAGVRFTQNIGVEVDYAQSGASSSVAGITYKASAAQIAAVATLPLNPMFDVFAKVGMSANKVTFSGAGANCPAGASCSKTDVMYGIGGQYNVNEQFGIRLQYEHLGKATSSNAGGDIALSTMSLGVVWAF